MARCLTPCMFPPVPKWPSILPARSRLILRRRAARFTTILILASSMTFYLKAPTVKVLNTRQRDLTAVLLNAGLQPVKPEFDVAPLNGYLRALPMCFNPMHDKKHWYTRLTFVQHMANLLPVFGRDTGTGHPGFTFFNRGGAPLTFDPLNRIVPRMPTWCCLVPLVRVNRPR
ncbi:Type IV secretory pathway%2C VirB4 components [Yersinia enterocolitica]|nr:Type IV secretory pathway%2C VirB4 components [Yersinia enterocolitica]